MAHIMRCVVCVHIKETKKRRYKKSEETELAVAFYMLNRLFYHIVSEFQPPRHFNDMTYMYKKHVKVEIHR